MKEKRYPLIQRLFPIDSLILGEQILRFGVSLFLLILFSFGQLRGAWCADYHGQVVDAETGKPIEGAVVVVEWHKKAIYEMDGGSTFHNAREALTGADGKFVLDSSPGIDWNPLTHIQAPEIIVFYPGYRPFTAAHPEDIGTISDLYEIAEAFEHGVVVKLKKLTSEKEGRRYTDSSGFGSIRASYAIIPNFHRLINVQRKIVGMREITYP
jgi:hypothetical protein